MAADLENTLYLEVPAGRVVIEMRPDLAPKHCAQIKELVHAYTRLDMPAHRFRHAAAKIYLDRNPGQNERVRLLLSHKEINTTNSSYAGAESAAAARHYAEMIRQIQEASYPLNPRRKRRA